MDLEAPSRDVAMLSHGSGRGAITDDIGTDIEDPPKANHPKGWDAKPLA